MKIAIIGMGLIGGSLARTIKLHTDHTVYACDLSAETLNQAQLFNAFDAVLTDESLRQCDLVLVALYPQGIIDWIQQHAADFKPGCVVIDCGGVKQVIVNALQNTVKDAPWHYIGGHPMAGREFSGFRYARDDLFDRASMILCPSPEEDLQVIQDTRNFFIDLGFRRVQFTTPKEHDEMIAFTSQLAHIVSSAYVKCPRAQAHRGFSAGSFADMTRVARLNEDMWTELFFDNREALLPELEGLVDRLTAYRDALRQEDRDAMHDLLKEGRKIKEKLSE